MKSRVIDAFAVSLVLSAQLCSNIDHVELFAERQPMPAKPAWYLRIPEIIALLSKIQAPIVDRATCESLFGVRRRRAIELLQSFGGCRVGNTILLDRPQLIQRLRQLQSDPDVVRENARKQRFADELDQLRRQSAGALVKINPIPAPCRACAWAPPAGIMVSAGKLSVEFTTVEELLSRLYALAQGIAADYDAFSIALSHNQTRPRISIPAFREASFTPSNPQASDRLPGN